MKGMLPDGTPYAADDPRLLAWVHVTEAVLMPMNPQLGILVT